MDSLAPHSQHATQSTELSTDNAFYKLSAYEVEGGLPGTTFTRAAYREYSREYGREYGQIHRPMQARTSQCASQGYLRLDITRDAGSPPESELHGGATHPTSPGGCARARSVSMSCVHVQ